MMKITTISKAALIAGFALTTILGSCSKDNDTVAEGEPATGNSKYFIAATVGTGTYLLTTADLESGSVTTTGNGVELPRSYTTWVMNGTKAAVGLIYADGDPGIGVSYGLNSSGNLAPVGNEFQINSRYTTWGSFDHYIITGVSGQALTTGETGATFNFIDVDNSNTLTTKAIVTSNFTGNGDIATFSGIVDFGNGEFLTGVIASGVKAAGSGGGSSVGVVNYPDSVWVAAFDADLNVKRIYRDNRISYASGRYRSANYSMIDKDDEGNVYVFSGAYEAKTTKPAGALLIKKDATAFDAAYYFNIQEKSGGYRFRKAWHVTEDYFMLEFYNETTYVTTTPATQYAIVKMSDKSFNWVTSGFPAKDQITAVGVPFAEGGKMYFPVTAANASPTIYVIDPKAASAKAGLVVQAETIAAVSKMTY